jgi:epoxyqueuosine reductase
LKEEIRNYAQEIGVDDIGFASVENYNSPNSPPINEIYPKAKTIIVMGFQPLDNYDSENIQIASSGSKIVSDFANACTYKLARYIKQKFKAKVISITQTPVNINKKTTLPFADLSLRHAAVAAGLGTFGRHNLVIHPIFGTKIRFTAIITNLEIRPDVPIKDSLCTDCDICVKQCPAKALDEEGRTDVMKCMLNSQPNGFIGNIQFWSKFADSSPEEQKLMIQDEKFKKLYDVVTLGNQYVCFNCIRNCPVGDY